MRPVTKNHPQNQAGVRITFEYYLDARQYLIEQICRYCSFCEMPILNMPAVEHIKPKNCEGNPEKYANLRNHWSNFLLICAACNSTKGNRDIKLGNYYWPHKNNTILAFEGITGLIQPKGMLNPDQTIKAIATIELYGLNKIKDSSNGIDIRFEQRLKVISQAIERLQEYQSNPPITTENNIIDAAENSGFWSVWYTIFNNEINVKQLLINELNAATNCFDPNFNPIPRNPNDPHDTI
jgi:HNH endonuclease